MTYMAVMFIRQSRTSNGNMACLINAVRDAVVRPLQRDVQLLKSAHMESQSLQKRNYDISLTSTFGFLTFPFEGLKKGNTIEISSKEMFHSVVFSTEVIACL